MKTVKFNNKTYTVGFEGFLIDSKQWDENFAVGMASKVGLKDGLTTKQWKIINFIRKTYEETKMVPLVYQTCRMFNLHLKDLKSLFPSGYLRGACKLAGITYREGFMRYHSLESEEIITIDKDKTYQVDIRGFLVNSQDWNKDWACHKAFEMKMLLNLTDKHWEIIHYLRTSFEKNKVIPTVYETCEVNNIDIAELEQLFPDGYHRGAVKLSGLCVR